MKKGTVRIDLVKLILYLLKRCWIIILCAAIGFGLMHMRGSNHTDTYTSSGTMYVTNNNPNQNNYGYASISDLSSAVELVNLYTQVLKSENVTDRIIERLIPQGYGYLTNSFVAGTISMVSQNGTSYVRVYCTTFDPQMSQAICNAVLDVAPAALTELVGAGDCAKIDSATLPVGPDYYSPRSRYIKGGLAGAVLAAGILAVLFLFNQKISSTKDITDNYTPPVLAGIKRYKGEGSDPGQFLLNSKSEMGITESYSKLRMNLLYTLVEKENNAIVITSAIAGEGKSTIAANLAISCAMSGKKVLLVDADMRRACQRDIFHYKHEQAGLSNVLVGACDWRDTVINPKQHEQLNIMPAGQQPPNPGELLSGERMRTLLAELGKHFDLILLDAPPINIVSDPLALSERTAGSLFVIRQNFSEHREIRKALISAELTGMNILGFIFYGEKMESGSYYSRKYYKKGYYHHYYTRSADTNDAIGKGSSKKRDLKEKEES